MAVTGDTGNGTTVAFSSTTISGHVFQELGGGEATLGKVEASALGTSGDANYIPHDLRENADISGALIFSQDNGLPSLGTVETLTITFPKLVATNTAATLAGTGWISRTGPPTSIANNTLMAIPFSWTWDGDTGPTFTAET